MGIAWTTVFLDPFGPGLADIGALEAVRQALPSLVGPLPAGAPVLGDLLSGASDLSGTAADFNGAAFANMGADDLLLFTDATSAAQVSHDGTFLTFDADGDGVAEAQVWLNLNPFLRLVYEDGPDGGITITLAPALTAIGEVAQLTVGTSWQTLTFANTYIDPVVFALAPTLNEADAAATRFRNVTGDGAQIRLQETKRVIDPDTGLRVVNPGDHLDETVTLLVLEKGVHTFEDGAVIQVGEISTNKLYEKGFEDVSFAQSFETASLIFSQLQSFTGTDFIISHQRTPDVGGFQLTMQEAQADNINHSVEPVGWFAIEHGGGSLLGMDWQVGSSAQNVNGNLTRVMFDAAFDAAPLVAASLASYNGTYTASPRIGTVTPTQFHAMALEGQSHDLETNHGYQTVDGMVFPAAGTIYEQAPIAPAFALAGPEARVATTGVASAGDQTMTASFGGRFANPVVIASLTSAHDAGAAVARVSNVTATSFDVAAQETGEQNGVHGPENIVWIVMEAGSWLLTFNTGFSADPAVLSQTQTANDADFVKTRLQGVDADGFEMTLEEDEAAHTTGHSSETVGWIAVDKGVASGGDTFVFEAGDMTANQRWTADSFAGGFDAAPGLVAGMATFNGTNVAGTRIEALLANGFDLRVEEDQAHDAETAHAVETFHWIAPSTVARLRISAMVTPSRFAARARPFLIASFRFAAVSFTEIGASGSVFETPHLAARCCPLAFSASVNGLATGGKSFSSGNRTGPSSGWIFSASTYTVRPPATLMMCPAISPSPCPACMLPM
ncbi:MAG: hypothetical protein ACJARE_000386 [Paracoccaceae bacterium]|jgi:hypothetical protein